MKVAYYSPLPPERTGIADYSALLLPALRERVDVVVPKRGGVRARRRLRSTTSATTRSSTAGSSTRCGARPGVVVLHDAVLHHLVAGLTLARKDVDGLPERDGARGRASSVACSRSASSTAACRRSGRRGPRTSRSRARCSTLRGHGVIVHSSTSARRALAAGYDGPIRRIPMPVWPAPDASPPLVEGDPVVGSFGFLNANKRIPQLLDAFAVLAGATPARGSSSSARRRPASSSNGASRLGLDGRGRAPRLRERAALLVAARRVRRLRLAALADDGRDLGGRDPDALAREAARRQRRRCVPRASPTRSRSRSRRTSARSRRSRRRCSCSPRDRATRGDERAAREYASREHELERVAELYVAALEEAAGGRPSATSCCTRSRAPPRRSGSTTRSASPARSARSALAVRTEPRPARPLARPRRARLGVADGDHRPLDDVRYVLALRIEAPVDHGRRADLLELARSSPRATAGRSAACPRTRTASSTRS